MCCRSHWRRNSTRSMKTRNRETEIKWLDFLLMSIGSDKWKNVWEVREGVEALLPPHLIHRKKRTWSRGRRVTLLSFRQTLVGGVTRYAMKHGFVERSVPLQVGRHPENIGNHYLRLTAKGMQRFKRIRRYICISCLHTGITRPTDTKNSCCGHCHKRTLKFY